MTTSPRYTRRWAAEHPAEFLALCEPPSECPVCYEAFDEENPAQSPLLGDPPTRCRHFVCQSCWEAMTEQPMPWRCPVCREDVTQFVVDITCWSPMPHECIGNADTRLFVELATFALEARGMLPELRELGARLLQHLPR